jgi:hypothetical protein
MSDNQDTQHSPEGPPLTEMPELLHGNPEHKKSGGEDVQPLNECVFRDSLVVLCLWSPSPVPKALWQRQSAQTSRNRREGYKPKKAVGDKCYKAKANEHGDDL